jgi:RNA polymerase sigma-70 factor (ECF subfamily)
MAEDWPEAKFIERLRARDERAFNDLVKQYERRVFSLLVRMLGRRDEAEDLAQEVFVQVFKAIGTFRGDAKLSTWIFRIAVNLSKNRVKYLSRRPGEARREIELEPAAERSALDGAKGTTVGTVAQPDDALSQRQLGRIVEQAIARLEPEFREVLVLRDVEDLSYEEIAEITGLADGTVKSRLHRARAQLREAVEQATGEKIR